MARSIGFAVDFSDSGKQQDQASSLPESEKRGDFVCEIRTKLFALN